MIVVITEVISICSDTDFIETLVRIRTRIILKALNNTGEFRLSFTVTRGRTTDNPFVVAERIGNFGAVGTNSVLTDAFNARNPAF